jgi:2-methylisocitrate lyase-like PEP mutase family enzyme
MSGKLQAAAEARNDPDFVVIARTDSAAIEGINAAIARGKQYLEAGADALLIEGISRRDDIEAVSLAFRGDRLVLNWAEIGREPDVSITEIASLGFRLLLFPGSTLYAASEAMRRILQVIREDGTPQRALSSTTGLAEFMELIGLPEAQGIEDRFNR